MLANVKERANDPFSISLLAMIHVPKYPHMPWPLVQLKDMLDNRSFLHWTLLSARQKNPSMGLYSAVNVRSLASKFVRESTKSPRSCNRI